MNEDELRSRLTRGLAAPSAQDVERVMVRARRRALASRRPRLAAVLAVAVGVAMLLLGGVGVIASLKASRVPASPATAPYASPSSVVESPSPEPASPPVLTPVSPPAGGLPLVVLPTTAQVIPATGSVVWASVAGSQSDLLFRSADQGATWQQRTLPVSGGSVARSAISFVDGTHGWYLQASSPGTQCTGQGTAVWRTVDGAASWQNLAAQGIGFYQCKDNLSFVDQQTGFITAWDQNHQPVVYRTANGGASWTVSLVLPDPPGQRTSGGGFMLRPGPVVRFGVDLFVDGGGWQHLYVYRSRDGGATWAYLATVPGVTDVDEVAFLDASHWWLSGPGLGPSDRYTSDAGAHYAPARGAPDSAAPISPVFTFAGLNLGYATVRGTIWRTTDGGTHWSTLHTPGT